MVEALITGSFHVFELQNLLFLFLGTALGIVFGALPGLTATMGLALLVPFTFSMPPATGLLMLAGIYIGAMYGDAIPAILINTPGTPAAIATTFDGYPLAQKGMAQHALVTAAFSSSYGSFFANIVLITSAAFLAEASLKFGPPEYFWLGIFGLTIISVLSVGNIIKGLLTGVIGLLISTVGMATLAGDVRLTFGFTELQGGIELAVALIGFFCLPEILSSVIGRRRETYSGEQVRPNLGVIRDTIFYLLKRPILMFRSSIVGLIVGIAPGAGGNLASMISYSEATRWEKNPEEFGKGTIRGVAASEAANSAMAPGSLIPLLTLGIPGSPPAAVILGALMLHGMKPGVELFSAHAGVTYAFIMGLQIAAVAVLVIGTLGSFVYARIINIPSRALAPVIILMTILGSYAIRNNMLDVWVMFIFGIIGYILQKLRYHPAPLVLGFILGSYIEDGLLQSILVGRAAGGVIKYMVTRPICLVLIALCLISALWPLISARRYRQSRSSDKETDSSTGLNTDLIMGTLTLAMAALIYFSTRNLSYLGGLFIFYCVVALAFLSLLVIVKGFIKPTRMGFFESVLERNRVIIGLIILAVYLALIPYLGFLPSSYCFYFIFNIFLSKKRFDIRTMVISTVSCAVMVTALYFVFHYFLLVPLPTGAWFYE
jgi:putative tricarboxylic transport membrane protein